jgi:hypothetical protein
MSKRKARARHSAISGGGKRNRGRIINAPALRQKYLAKSTQTKFFERSGIIISCCGVKQSTRGCVMGKLHVWNCVIPGINDLLNGYVRTRFHKTPPLMETMTCYTVRCAILSCATQNHCGSRS